MILMKIRGRRIHLFTLLVAAAALLFGACNNTPALLYHNFLADLDILTRFNLTLNRLGDGEYDSYTKDEIVVLRQDLSTWDIDDHDTAEINDMFIAAADSMHDCMGLLRDGDAISAALMLEQANAYFTEAKALIIRHNMGAEYV